MRLQLKLESRKTVTQEHFFKSYFTDMHGILAKIVGKDEDYGKFCFGNIFPILKQQIDESKIYSLIISSSEPGIIEKLFFSFEIGSNINIGELQFKIIDVNIFTRKLHKNTIIESMTPLNITINDNGNVRFLKFDNPKYLEYLGQHLLNKYTFLKGNKSEIDLFENVDLDVHEKHPFSCFQINFYNKGENKNFKVCGSKLVFKFNNISDEQLKIFQTLFDSGFGERTTFGAGFMIERIVK